MPCECARAEARKSQREHTTHNTLVHTKCRSSAVGWLAERLNSACSKCQVQCAIAGCILQAVCMWVFVCVCVCRNYFKMPSLWQLLTVQRQTPAIYSYMCVCVCVFSLSCLFPNVIWNVQRTSEVSQTTKISQIYIHIYIYICMYVAQHKFIPTIYLYLFPHLLLLLMLPLLIFHGVNSLF